MAIQPTPYNAALFRALADDSDIDLIVHFKTERLTTHPWASDMTEGYTVSRKRSLAGIDWALLHDAIRTRKAVFVVAGWREPRVVTLLNLLIALRRRFAVWTDTPRVVVNSSPATRSVRRTWLRRVFRHASSVLGTGTPALDALRRLDCPPEKLVNFPYFVDLDQFRPASRQEPTAPLSFLSSGYLINEIKGWDLAIRALAKARDMTENDNFTYRIAGAGSDRGSLEELAEELGLESRVSFEGWLEPDDLPDFYQSGDVLLHPARREAFGVAILEAMACGLPVIGSNAAGAVLDRVTHMVNGLVHESEDVDNLAKCLALALSQPDLIKAMREPARRKAEEWPISRGVAIIKARLTG